MINMREGNLIIGLEKFTKILPENIIMCEIGSYSGQSAEIF